MLHVSGPSGANLVARGICRYPNENPKRIASYFEQYIQPSLNKLNWDQATAEEIKTPTLIIHGSKDRINPSGASKDWAKLLPNSELKIIDGGGHLPWIESQQEVLGSIRSFLINPFNY